MTDVDVVRRFYDDLAGDDERIYADWTASSRRQARALDAFLPPQALVLDCAAGVGTQLLRLAALGAEAGLVDMRRLLPEQSGFFQPLLLARRPG